VARVRERSYPPSVWGAGDGGAGPPSITAVAPPSVVAGATARTFTATGANIVAPVEVFYAGAGPSGQVPATAITATSFQFTLPAGTTTAAGTVIWNADIGATEGVSGPNITVTAADIGTTGADTADTETSKAPAKRRAADR
jgi:hypothetical protein